MCCSQVCLRWRRRRRRTPVQEFHLLAFVFIFESEVDLFEPDALRNPSDARLPPHVSAALVIWGHFAGLWGDVPRMPRLNPLQSERPCMSLCTPMHMHMHNDARLLHITSPAALCCRNPTFMKAGGHTRPGERFGNHLGCLGELRLGPRIVCQMWCIVAAPDVNLAGPDESAWLAGSAGRTLGVGMKDGKARQSLSSNSTPATQPNATHLTPHTHTQTTTSPPFAWQQACEWLLGVMLQVAVAAPSGR
jgi:hypothetical protein